MTDTPAQTTQEASGFGPPAAPSLSLGVVGNCAFNALIDPLGRVVWSCLPRFDGDPVFHALLGGEDGAGAFAFEIENLASSKQHYEPNTAVLRTELWDTHGQGLLITDFAMPEMHGRELAQRVRQRCPTAKVLYQTGCADLL